MLDKLRDWLDKHFDKYMPKLPNKKYKYAGSFGYYAILVIYYIIQFGLLFLFGKLFNNLLFIGICSIVYNSIIVFSSAFHCHLLDHCIIITQVLFIIFGILSKIAPLWAVFLLCLYSCRNIYQKSPIEINDDFKNKKEDWYFKKIVCIMIFYLLIALVLYYFKFFEICKCIMWGLIMIDLMLFKNNKDYI